MGQYFKPVNITKKEWLYSHDYNNGLKLMEHSWIGNNFVQTVESLLTPGNSWSGDRIVWSGDYAEDLKLLVDKEGVNIYSLCSLCSDESEFSKLKFKNIKPEGVVKLDKSYRYIVNIDKGMFVDKKKVPKSENGWQIHPLPLLTSQGNGKGGGDFYGDDDKNIVGSWAGDRIVVSATKPDSNYNYTELSFNLVESR
jgi:hypothetical protein